jgi:hypothetical protein
MLVTPGAYPRKKHLRGAPIRLALALPSNSKTRQERVSKDKRSSILGLIISDEGKKFYNIDTRSPSIHPVPGEADERGRNKFKSIRCRRKKTSSSLLTEGGRNKLERLSPATLSSILYKARELYN